MDELVQFLLDCLAIEEHVAKAASPGPWHINPDDDEVLAVDNIVVAEGFALSGKQLRATIEHIARHDPARALAEVEAKRRLLDGHQPDTFGGCTTCARPEDFDDDTEGNRTFSRSAKPWPCPTLRLLALPYADHPDYQETWKP